MFRKLLMLLVIAATRTTLSLGTAAKVQSLLNAGISLAYLLAVHFARPMAAVFVKETDLAHPLEMITSAIQVLNEVFAIILAFANVNSNALGIAYVVFNGLTIFCITAPAVFRAWAQVREDIATRKVLGVVTIHDVPVSPPEVEFSPIVVVHPDQPHTPASPADWRCSKCGLSNSAGSQKCEICHTQRPGLPLPS